MDNIIGIISSFVIALIVIAVVAIFIAFPIMWCWNYTVVLIWKLSPITWGQAWCIYFLANCLIKASK